MKKIRWGVIGLGIGLLHAKTLKSLPNSELVAVCDSNISTLEKVREELGSIAYYSNGIKMLEEENLDAIAIATFDNKHAYLIVDAIQKGIHVFAEKPIATTQKDLGDIFQALKSNPSVKLSTNTLLRLSPRFDLLKNKITSRELGEIFHFEADYLYGRLEKLLSGWRSLDPNYSVTLGGAIHLVDLIMWLIEEKPNRVFGLGSDKGSRQQVKKTNSQLVSHDLRIALLEFPSGITGKISANFGCVHPHFHKLDIYGTAGTFSNSISTTSPSGFEFRERNISNSSSALLMQSRSILDKPELFDMEYPGVDKSALLTSFHNSLITNEPAIVSIQEAFDVMSVCLAIDKSVKEGIPVKIDYFGIDS